MDDTSSLNSLYLSLVSVIKFLADHVELVVALSYTLRWVCGKPEVICNVL